MLLNEFLKEHRKVEEQDRKVEAQNRKAQEREATIAQLSILVGRQQKQIEVLTATVQKVSDQMELSRPAAQVVANNQ
jgi:hypothetical protein